MIDRETAVRIVEEQLAREHREEPEARRTVVLAATEHELVWIVGCSTEEFARTRDVQDLPVGPGLYLVDRVDGELYELHAVAAATGGWEDDYRARIRGLPVRTAVDALHEEVRALAAEQGPLRAARALRERVPALPPVEAVGYVRALLTGEAPARLVDLVRQQVVPPPDPFLTARRVRRVRRVRGPGDAAGGSGKPGDGACVRVVRRSDDELLDG
ncbi:YrhB domain-containing protein [Kitasatospora sp. NPDC088134]|uniref:YrhB domain-containing protein n=1 Tax=Kitasatospora sp. NPDC088134 TaxID=3364071 RepID=UPI0038025F50